MRARSIVPAVLIVSGFAFGAALGVHGGTRPLPAELAVVPMQETAPSPIELNTGKPPSSQRVPLAKPVSLEGAFGRSELSGSEVKRVPANPLSELNIDRRWDIALDLRPPRPGLDLPSAPAADEVNEPEPGTTELREQYDFSALPQDARARAQDGVKALREGAAILREGEKSFREPGQAGLEGRKKVREAAVLLRHAGEQLASALRVAPGNRELLDLLQESKALLYFCLKHGM